MSLKPATIFSAASLQKFVDRQRLQQRVRWLLFGIDETLGVVPSTLHDGRFLVFGDLVDALVSAPLLPT